MSKKNHFISIKNVSISDSFFSPIQKTVMDVMIPYQEKALHDEIPDIKKSHVIENLRIAAGESDEKYYGRIFQDSDLAKWIEAAAYSLTLRPDPELEARVDEIIDLIGRVQRPDGYLNSYFIAVAPERRWQNLADCHELYCAGHMTEAAVAYYEATGKDVFLNICRRLCDHIDGRFGKDKITGIPGHEEIELALMRLYRATGEERYLKLASYFVDERGKDPEFFHKEEENRGWSRTDYVSKMSESYMQNHKPLREQDKVEGHAVRCMYLLTAAADIAAVTDDRELMSACKRLWENMVEKRMYITGGIGSTAYGEAFTEDYDLPNDTAYAETCAAVGVCFFARQMLEAEISSRYADIMERALYNGTISGMQLDGTKFFYINQLEANPEMSSEIYGEEEYTPQRIGWYDCACCPPNLARLLTSLGSYVWSSNEDTVYSHLFVGGNASFLIGKGVDIALESRYPWDGELVYTINPADGGEEFTLAVRYPGWCHKMEVFINGERAEDSLTGADGYWRLSRVWKAGDKVVCHMDMPVRRIYANPLVRADAGCAAFMRGPVVYAFEGIDNGEALQTIRIPRDEEVKALPYDPELLGGIVPLEVSALQKEIPDTLYCEQPPAEKPVKLRAVPYYAWSNRGLTHMRVWMQE